MYTNISEEALNFNLKPFLDSYLGKDIVKVTLSISKQYSFDFTLLAEQLLIYSKAKSKLPTFTNHYCFFTSKSYEQCSSEALANYKASLFNGSLCLDLCGGLGVDDWAFSKKFTQVISLDIDSLLNKLVRKNFEKLGVKNIERLNINANDFIKQNEQEFDLIYIDADRRPEAMHKRVVTLTETEPNILTIQNRLLMLSDTVLLKLSPMLDITTVINDLKNVSDVYVISLHNEVKELLVVMKKVKSKIFIHAVNIGDGGIQQFSNEWNNKVRMEYNDNGKYFFEPSLSLIKSALSSSYGIAHHLKMLASNTYYFVGDDDIHNFFGRSFKIINRVEFNKSTIKKYVTENGISKANISKRNFPIEVDELKKIFSIKDGGEEYLFFTQNVLKQKLMFHCRK